MKIQNIKGAQSGIRSIGESEAHGSKVEKPLVFRKTLTDLSEERHKEHLKSLIGDIEKQGEQLKKKADITEFERYRKLIREFLADIVSNGYSFSKESTYGTRGRHKYITIIKTIDEKLDALAKDVLSNQADNIAIVSKIDDIRGLILDMLL